MKKKLVSKKGKQDSSNSAPATRAALNQQLIFVGLLAVSTLLSFGLIKTLVISELVKQTTQLVQKTTTDEIAHQLKNLSSLFDNSLAGITQDTLVLDAIENQNLALLSSLEGTLKAILPHASQVYLLPKGSLRTRKKSEEISFTTQNLIRKLDKGETPPLEYFKNQNQPFLILGTPIKIDDNVIGSATVVFEGASIFKTLPQLNNGQSSLRISLVNEGGKTQPMYTLGNENTLSGPSTNVTQDNTQWSIEYNLGRKTVSSLFNQLLYWGLAAAATVLALLLIGLSYWQINNRIKSDLKNLLAASRKPSSNNKKSPYQWQAFFVAENTLKDMLKSSPSSSNVAKTTNTTQTPQNKPTQPAKEEEEEDFMDLDINFEDEDLFAPAADEAEEKAEGASKQAQLPSEVFRQYDIRGIVGDSLTPAFVKTLGQAIGTYTLNKGFKEIAVGRDGRISSPDMSQALIQGICQSGCNVTDIGEVPTPLVYFAATQADYKSGVMVTGSHNPPNYNGFKMVVGGETLFGQHILDLKRFIEHDLLKTGSGSTSESDNQPNYLNRVCSDVSLSRPLKVVVDAGNGVAGPLAVQLIEQLGCEVIPLYCDIDGNFPNHHPDPSKPENLADLTQSVAENQADVGLAFDGDGDRLGVVTPTGDMVFPDRLLMLFARQVLSDNKGEGTIIYDVKCTGSLKGFIQDLGGQPVMWKTGHSLIKAKMKETGALLAGEMSGHIFFNDRWFGFDDALYSAARLLEIIAADNNGIDALMADIPKLHATPEINIKVSEQEKFQIISQVTQTGTFSDGHVSTIDGIRVDYANGWGLVRASNTTPCLVARFEASDEEQLTAIQAEFRQNLLNVKGDLDLPF